MPGGGGGAAKLLPRVWPKLAASAFLGLGVVGLGVAAASHFSGTWQGNFQAGSVLSDSNCQPSNQPIGGGFAPPTFDPNAATPWTPSGVLFTGISSNCLGANYQVAYRDHGDWELLGSADATGVVSGSQVSVSLGSVDWDDTSQFAISFFD